MTYEPLKTPLVQAARQVRLSESTWRACGISETGQHVPSAIALLIGELGDGAQPLAVQVDTPAQAAALVMTLSDAAAAVWGDAFFQALAREAPKPPDEPKAGRFRVHRRASPRRRGGGR